MIFRNGFRVNFQNLSIQSQIQGLITYNKSFKKKGDRDQILGMLSMENNRKAEIVIQNQIMAGVYSFHEDIFRNRKRFEMILSQPDDHIEFERVMTVFKGRFICKNDKCLQQMRTKKRITRKESWETDEQGVENRSWLKWWENSYEEISFEAKIKQEAEKQAQNFTKTKWEQKEVKINGQKQTNSEVVKSKQDQVKKRKENKQTKKEEKEVKIEEGKQNTRWSSCLTYVKFYYYTNPQPLHRLMKAYDRKDNNKCEIYFYVELLGQKCTKCQSQEYCYPFFGHTELKRMRKNFSSYIYNTIFNRPILRYKPCKLQRLYGHQSEFCQACQLGQCGIRSF